MKTIYFECSMGAAGDMLMAALLELCDDRQGFLDRLNDAGIPGVVVTAEPSVKCGIAGTRVRVLIDGREEDCHDHYHNDGHDDHHHDHTHHHRHDGEHHDDDHHHNHTHHHRHDDDDHHHDSRNHDFHDHRHHHHTKDHSHSGYHDIEHLVNHLKISDNVKKNTLDIYKLIAEAESLAHGVPVDRIHFHEVGETDAVADIVGVCMLMEELSPDAVISSPVNTGNGHVRCAHGVLPVPAPATAHILKNVPIYNNEITGELCTPTGAAVLKHFVRNFQAMPVMSVSKIGYGMGKKDFQTANCVRAYMGSAVRDDDDANLASLGVDFRVHKAVQPHGGRYGGRQTTAPHWGASALSPKKEFDLKDFDFDFKDFGRYPDAGGGIIETVTELSCNLDDMTPEAIAFAQELLLGEGALDVWAAPAVMKKGRMGTLLGCLCRDDIKPKIISLMFKHTTTLGIRENACKRYALHREISETQTPHGTVRIKNARGFGVKKSKPEYDDIAAIAREKGMSVMDVV